MNVRGVRLRKLAYAGARYGPRLWVKYSPAFFGVAFACALPGERAKIRASLARLRASRGRLGDTIDVVRTFVAYAHCLAESLGAERAEALSAVPEVRGAEHLRAAAQEGKGVIVVTAHCGAWDAAARFLARDYDADVLVVMAPEEDTRARGLSDVIRERGRVRVAHVGGHPLESLKVLRHLRRGGFLAVQLDRIEGLEATVEVRLGNEPFRVPAGPFRLAALTGAPIVPVFTSRLGYFRHLIEVAPPIRVPRRTSPEQGLVAAAGGAAAAMERFLSENPTQWFPFAH
ncbi:MAG TPA: lysophospholipid acyltransferase family protein [Polyangiaceae bacterium]|nr:lysophospholipid acyltransferase family protein [Polyangiaceae bacterium]